MEVNLTSVGCNVSALSSYLIVPDRLMTCVPGFLQSPLKSSLTCAGILLEFLITVNVFPSPYRSDTLRALLGNMWHTQPEYDCLIHDPLRVSLQLAVLWGYRCELVVHDLSLSVLVVLVSRSMIPSGSELDSSPVKWTRLTCDDGSRGS